MTKNKLVFGGLFVSLFILISFSLIHWNLFRFNGAINEKSLNVNRSQSAAVLSPTLNEGLIGYYKFEEEPGASIFIATDSSANRNNGNIIGAQMTAGKLGNALNFSGTNNYVSLSKPLPSFTEFTASAWVKVNDLNAVRGIFTSGGTNGKGFRFRINPDGSVWMLMAGGSASVPYDILMTKAGVIQPGVFYHITVAGKSGQYMKIYVNGVLAKEKTSAQTIDTPISTGYIGSSWSPGLEMMNGIIDDVRVYNRTLSNDEIANLALEAQTQSSSSSSSPIGVMNPWTPIKVEQASKKVSVWGRDYVFGNNGLPAHIYSQGADILSRPANLDLEISINGNNRIIDTNQSALAFKDISAGRVTVESKYSADFGDVITSANIEYDGMMTFDVKIKPKPSTVLKASKLVLEIPLNKEIAKLFNHSYYEKQDQNDRVDSNNDFGGGLFSSQDLSMPFSPLVWFGNENLGLQWFSEDMKGWSVTDQNQILKILNNNGSPSFYANIISKDKDISADISFKFGLIATPVKSYPNHEIYSGFSMAQAGSAEQALTWFKHKRDASGAITTPLDEAVKKGLKYVVIHELWTELQGYPGTSSGVNKKYLENFIGKVHKIDTVDAEGKKDGKLKVLLYIGRDFSTAAPEYSDVMIRMPKDKGKARTDNSTTPPTKTVSYLMDANASTTAFLVPKVEKLIDDYDIDGLFMDDISNITACVNGLHGHGYTDENGNERPTYPILETRDQMRQLYNLFHGGETPIGHKTKDGIILAHNGTPFSPGLDFADLQYAGEAAQRRYVNGYWVSSKPADEFDYFSMDELRSLYGSRQYGIPLIYLTKGSDIKAGSGKKTDEEIAYGEKVYREYALKVLPDDLMPRFGWPDLKTGDTTQEGLLFKVWKIRKDFGLDDVAFYPYWKNQGLIAVSPAQAAKLSFFRKNNGDLLLFLSNASSTASNIDLTFDLNALNLNNKKLSFESVSGKSLTIDNSILRVKFDLINGSYRNYEVIKVAQSGDLPSSSSSSSSSSVSSSSSLNSSSSSSSSQKSSSSSSSSYLKYFFNLIYSKQLSSTANSFILTKVNLIDRSKEELVNTVNAVAPSNTDVYYFKLINGDDAVVYSGYGQGIDAKNNGSSIYLKNLATGREFKVAESSDGFKNTKPSAIQKKDGTILVAYTVSSFNPKLSDPVTFPHIMIRQSTDNGKKWEFNTGRGLFENSYSPHLTKLNDGSVGLVLSRIEAERTGSSVLHRILYFYKSADGVKWPQDSRIQIYYGKEGFNVSQSSVIQLENGKIVVAAQVRESSEKGDSSIIVSSSLNKGQTWSNPKTILNEKYPIRYQLPILSKTGNLLVLNYKKAYTDQKITKRASVISSDDGINWKNEVVVGESRLNLMNIYFDDTNILE